MKRSNVYDCTIIELDKHHSDRKGNITVVENNNTIPFEIRRAYYLYDIPGGEERGAHAHKELQQLIIATSGSFDVVLDDGKIIAIGKHEDLLNTCDIYREIYISQQKGGNEDNE